MTQAAPTSGCEIGGPGMTAKSNKNDIQTIHPKRASGLNQVKAPSRGTGYQQAAAAADLLRGIPGGSEQEQLEGIEEVSAAVEIFSTIRMMRPQPSLAIHYSSVDRGFHPFTSEIRSTARVLQIEDISIMLPYHIIRQTFKVPYHSSTRFPSGVA